MKQAAPESFYYIFFPKEVVFIPQLKSLLWQTAGFTAEPEWHTHRERETRSLHRSPTVIERGHSLTKQWLMSYGAVKTESFVW